MSVIVEAHAVTRRFGATTVLENVSARINAGEKVGLIGVNGSGKTTLARVLAGLDAEFEGLCRLSPGVSVAYVPQYLDSAPETTCLDYMTRDLEPLWLDLRRCEEQLACLSAADSAAVGRALAEYQRARDAYDAAGGDEARASAEAALDAVGLPGRAGSAVGMLSGGEQNVLCLAKAVARRPDLMILDEPGNHLDFDGLEWLERFIVGFPGAVMIVSHNRYLLDRTTSATIEIANGAATRYEGNYSAYRLARLRIATAQQADYVADAKKLARLEALVAKFARIARDHADPAWGRRLRARRTQLEHARTAATDRPVLTSRSMEVALGRGQSRAEVAVELRGYSKAFGDLVLFDHADALIRCGERVAIVGANGSGKTTLLRDIVERGSWDDPQVRVGPSMHIGYCAQHQDIFRPDATIFEEMVRFGVKNEADAMRLLGRYLFSYEDLTARIRTLSGGERNRLQFAACELAGANLLVLDEPTNHMDIASREAIEDALEEFTGTVILVSHDRYLIEAVASRVVEIVDRTLVGYDAGYTEYRALRRSRPARVHTRRRERSTGEDRGNGGVRAGGTSRANRSRLQELERRVSRLEEEKIALERRITEAFESSDHRGGRRLTNELEQCARELDSAWESWSQLAEE